MKKKKRQTLVFYNLNFFFEGNLLTLFAGFVLAAFMAGMIIGSFSFGYLGKYGVTSVLYVLFGFSVRSSCFSPLSLLPSYLQLGSLLVEMFAFHENTQFFKDRNKRKFEIRKSNPFAAMKLILGTNKFTTAMAIIYALHVMAIADSTTMYLYLFLY